jgi:formylglycine-generating enzyme required for sulfatase activity
LSIDLGDGVKMEFVLIPPGTFMMGEEKGADNETPAHRVTITRPFYLAKYEVTREQYQEVIQGVPGKVDRPRHPVDFARGDLEECMPLDECNANRCMASAGEAYEWLKRLNDRLEPVCNEEAGNG